MVENIPNSICIDCFANHVEFASLNNGVFLCNDCAKIHMTFPPEISTLVETIENIDNYSALFIQRGGNSRFYNFISGYGLTETPSSIKYRTKACDYYRKLLKSEVDCDVPPQRISLDEGKKLMNK